MTLVCEGSRRKCCLLGTGIMWRSFFFAVGVMLIILGFECLIADRFEISRSARIPNFVARMFETTDSPKNSVSNSNGSLFQPSRFNNPFNRNQASSGNLREPAKRPFSLAGWGSGQNRSENTYLRPGRGTRIVYTREWMPWSLLAAGTLVVLYTKASKNRLGEST